MSERAHSYGIPGVKVDGFDVLAVYAATVQAVEGARSGAGPTLLVTESYRFEGHYAGEPQVYRQRAAVQEYVKKDPIPRFCSYLVERGVATQQELQAVDAEIAEEIADAIAFAKASPAPDPATVTDFIYA